MKKFITIKPYYFDDSIILSLTKNWLNQFDMIPNFDVFIDGGIIDSKGESTIIEIEDEKIKIIREGSLSKNEIIKC